MEVEAEVPVVELYLKEIRDLMVNQNKKSLIALNKIWGCLEKTRRPLICGLAVEFPAKVALEGNRVLSADVLPRQNRFWWGISEHKFNSHYA